MTKNIIIVALIGLLAMTLTIGTIGAQGTGSKPEATVKTGTVQDAESVTVIREEANGSPVSTLTSSVPFTVVLTDPATGTTLREMEIMATVNLASLTSKTQDLKSFVADGNSRLEEAVAAASVTITEPEIEEWQVVTDDTGNVVSVPMQINGLVNVGDFYAERVRFDVEGLAYTMLSTSESDVNTLFADIEANALNAFAQ